MVVVVVDLGMKFSRFHTFVFYLSYTLFIHMYKIWNSFGCVDRAFSVNEATNWNSTKKAYRHAWRDEIRNHPHWLTNARRKIFVIWQHIQFSLLKKMLRIQYSKWVWCNIIVCLALNIESVSFEKCNWTFWTGSKYCLSWL